MTEAPSPIPRRLLRAEQVLAARTGSVSLLLEGSQDPHNVHAVLRTAEALGVQDVHVVTPRGEAATIAPGVTQSAHEWLNLVRHRDLDSAVELLRGQGRSLWGTGMGPGARSLTGFIPEGPCAVLFGNETRGLSDRALECCDGVLRIDLVGFSGSLNLSVSAAIVIWELRRSAVASGGAGDLDERARVDLRDRWYRKLLAKRVRSEEAVERWLARAPEIASKAAAGSRLEPVERSGG